MKPHITKIGTIDCDLVETTPVVFGGRLYRFEYVREQYANNTTGDSYFRFVDHATGEPSEAFAAGYHLGNVMVENGTLFVTGTNDWDGERVDIFASRDMRQWESWNALDLPGYCRPWLDLRRKLGMFQDTCRIGGAKSNAVFSP